MDATRFLSKSHWLKPADIGEDTGDSRILKVTEVSEVMAKRDDKSEYPAAVLHFNVDGDEKKLQLNQTNLKTMLDFSKDEDDWVGLKLGLFTVPEPKAKEGAGIRIKAVKAGAKAAGATEATAPASTDVTDDDIPF